MTEVLQNYPNDLAQSDDAIYDANGNFTGDYFNQPYGTPDNLGNNYFSTANYTDNLYGGTGSTTLHYVGGNKYVLNYVTGDVILSYPQIQAVQASENDMYVYTTTGGIDVHDVHNKAIILVDTEGYIELVGYMSTLSDEINMSAIPAYTCGVGAPYLPNNIWAGQLGSYLWGGGPAQDTLIGNASTDFFVAGKNDGNDLIFNAESQDTVFLSNTSLADLAFAVGDTQSLSIGFNNGSVLAVQSTEALSAKFVLEDGSAYQFNHVANSWQNA